MTDEQRRDALGKAHQAESAWAVIAPILQATRAEYQDRMISVATTELGSQRRADMLTALAYAIKITGNIEAGLQAIIKDGELAQKELIKADKIERMTAPQRRLLNIGGY